MGSGGKGKRKLGEPKGSKEKRRHHFGRSNSTEQPDDRAGARTHERNDAISRLDSPTTSDSHKIKSRLCEKQPAGWGGGNDHHTKVFAYLHLRIHELEVLEMPGHSDCHLLTSQKFWWNRSRDRGTFLFRLDIIQDAICQTWG